jgi:hypothetical protein
VSNDVSLRPCDAGSGRSRWRRSWLWLTVGIVVVGTLVFGAIRYGSERHPSAASAGDTGPIAVITSDPTCAEFLPTNIEVFEKLRSKDPDVRNLKSVGAPLEVIAGLAQKTHHRVTRELYEQYIAYTYALLESSARPEQVGREEGAIFALPGVAHTLVGICEAITSGAATQSTPTGDTLPVSDTAPPAGTPSHPAVFLLTPERTCENWRTTAVALGPDDTFKATTDSSPQIGTEAEFPTQQSLSDRIGYLSLPENRGDNPTFRDFSDLGRAYLIGYQESSKSDMLATYHAVVKLLRGACAYSELSRP